MLIVLNVGHRLAQVAVGADARRGETVLDLREVLLEHGYPVLADNDALHLARLRLLVPFVRANLLDRVSLGWIRVEDLLDEVSARFADDARNKVVATQYLLVQLARVWILERQVAARHSVQDDASRPDVRVQTMVSLAGNHLGSSVAWRAARSLQCLTLAVHVRETEVHDLYVVLVVEQQVLRFQVAMADLDLVDVLDTGDYLLHEATRLLFLQALPLDNVVEQFTSAGVLHDQEQLARRLDNLQ